MDYDVIIVGAGPGGIYSAYELKKTRPELKVAVFEAGRELAKRHCPIDGDKIKNCIGCKSCSIMSGFGGAGAFSDGKYNITNDFGGTLYEHIGRDKAIELMKYVDSINIENGGKGCKLYSTAGTALKKTCMQNKLKLLEASVRHLGTDINYVVLDKLYDFLKDSVDFYFNTVITSLDVEEDGYRINHEGGSATCKNCIISVGRSGSKWMESVCEKLSIPAKSNRV
ncbi:MAG: NAD(P)-binding protein, partial [Lachnospiraceae bacterium]|nr:NAD(P)-binding protein [Lachnospiraceae bacterium]